MKLVLPFVWVASTLLVFPFDVSFLIWIGGAALAGAILRHRLGRIGLGTLMFGGMFAGGVAGLLLILRVSSAPFSGAILGMFGVLPLAPVVGAAEWVRARPRSLLDGVSLRCALITAALVSIVFVAWGRLMELDLPHAPASLLSSGFLIVACSAIDAWRLLRLHHWRRDLGIGDPKPTYINQGSPYRSEPRVTSIVLGDLARTQRILMRQVTFDVASLMFALAGISAGLTT